MHFRCIIWLSRIDTTNLEFPFTEEEIWAAICSLSADKAPGLDGFPTSFYQVC